MIWLYSAVSAFTAIVLIATFVDQQRKLRQPDYAWIAMLERELLDDDYDDTLNNSSDPITAARVEIEQQYLSTGYGWMPSLIEREAMARERVAASAILPLDL